MDRGGARDRHLTSWGHAFIAGFVLAVVVFIFSVLFPDRKETKGDEPPEAAQPDEHDESSGTP
jgi:hypothetical protein